MAGGLKPPPSVGNQRGISSRTGNQFCVWCGRAVTRKRSDLPWRAAGSGNFRCSGDEHGNMADSGEHDVLKAPKLDPDSIRRWLDA